MKNNQVRISLCFIVCIFSLLASLHFGGSEFTLSDMFNLFLGQLTPEQEDLSKTILLNIRLPRTLVAALCGVALSAAGVLSQGLFRNSLASPSILGTTAGGSAAAAIMFYLGAANLHWFMLPMAAFAGALLTTFFILYVASIKRLYSLENLLLAGFAVNAFLSAVTSLVVSLVLEDYQKFPAVIYWLLGGLNGKGWEHFQTGIVPVIVGVIAAYFVCIKLNVLALGEDVAQTLSIDMRKLKYQTIAVIALLVGTTVSIAGAITFVGLIVPHLTRLMLGAENRRLLMMSSVNGISLVVLADLIARTVRSPMELQVGVLIALLGAPFFFWLLCRKDSRWEKTL